MILKRPDVFSSTVDTISKLISGKEHYINFNPKTIVITCRLFFLGIVDRLTNANENQRIGCRKCGHSKLSLFIVCICVWLLNTLLFTGIQHGGKHSPSDGKSRTILPKLMCTIFNEISAVAVIKKV